MGTPPTEFFDVVLRTNDHSVRFRFQMDNLYLLGYQMQNEDSQWLEFGSDGDRPLITESGVNFLGFDGSYGGLIRVAPQNSIQQVGLGAHNLVHAINQLAVTKSWPERAQSLIVVIMMISESTRFVPIFDHVATSFHYRPATTRQTEGLIQGWIMIVVRCWEQLSTALLHADENPEEGFQLRRPNNIRLPPNNTTVTTIPDVVATLGILLNLCLNPSSGPRRFPLMSSDNGGQCLLGLPLVQVFSVEINNIDGHELFGTITIDNGLYTENIYNFTRYNAESITSGHNATITGPSESVSAIGNFTIKLLLLTGNDTFIDHDISWNYNNVDNVYDEVISKELDSSRGSATVNYGVLRSAVSATITVTIEEAGEATAEIWGHVSTRYHNFKDPKTTCLLFDRPSENYVEVRRWQAIPLLRSVVAVPLDDSLLVTVRLYDKDLVFSDVVANGTVQISVPETIPSNTFYRVYGENGNWVHVTVYWTFGF